ncbi:MAG: hypothetical protein SFV19_11330 [Rhodospirillaceae bacterium]|nr:hypothetical protein [Rhodospirillaceae bacterium]
MSITSRYLLDLHYDPHVTPEELFREHAAFGEQYPPPPRPIRPPGEKIRVAYVSGDFRYHACACFLLPLIERHDRARFDVFCYGNLKVNADAVTDRFRELSHWRPITGLTDEQVIEQITADKIDVLVDCSGHTSGKRVSLFARRPAMVSVTFLGYPDTTGLRQIDYRLTDAVADPVHEGNTLATEELVRMPRGIHSYRPIYPTPPPAEPPCLKNGYITFCSFNNRLKTNDETLKVWTQVLNAVPNSRLVLKNPRWTGRPFLAGAFDRVTVLSNAEDHHPHFAAYGLADIALDTFPYSGTTTTCDAFWMGLPVVALRGRHHVGRTSASFLTQVGLTDLIAENVDQYVEIATRLAADRQRLVDLRANLRSLVQASPLGQADVVVRDLEDFYVRAIDRALGT